MTKLYKVELYVVDHNGFFEGDNLKHEFDRFADRMDSTIKLSKVQESPEFEFDDDMKINSIHATDKDYEDLLNSMNEECKEKGHDWTLYVVKSGLGFSSHDIEQAGYCERCSYDTHGEYKK